MKSNFHIKAKKQGQELYIELSGVFDGASAFELTHARQIKQFMNIREVEPHFKCSVIGAILSVEKHKTILQKCGYDVKRLKPYEYHQQIIKSSKEVA